MRRSGRVLARGVAVGGFGAIALGCAVKQVPVPEVAADERRGKAVVYFYRPSSMVGVIRTIDVFHGDAQIGRLTSGTHFLRVFAPGMHEVTAAIVSTKTLIFEARPGRTYYVRSTIDWGFPDAVPSLVFVHEGLGREEVAKTKYVVPD